MRVLRRLTLIIVLTQGLFAQPPAATPVIGRSATDLGDGSPAALAPISTSSFALAPDGTVFYAEEGRIRRIDGSGRIQTVLKDTGIAGLLTSIALDAVGNLYYSVSSPVSQIRRWSGGTPVVVAGGGTAAAADGVPAANGSLSVRWLAVNPAGALYFTDFSSRVFRIDAGGILRVVAGTAVRGTGGEGGPAVSAQLDTPRRLGFDAAGTLYLEDVTDTGVRLLTIDVTGRLVRVATPPFYGGPLLLTADGTLFFSQNGLMKLRPGSVPEPVTVTSGPGFEGCGTAPFPPTQLVGSILQVAADSKGLLLLTGSQTGDFRQRLLRLDATGALVTVAGGPAPFSGDGGPAALATLSRPSAVATDAAGNVYIGDAGNHRDRKVTPDGIIQTIAGTGPAAGTLYCRPPDSGYLNSITGLTLDRVGTLYISDAGSNRVWKMQPGGPLTPFAGNGLPAAYGAAPGLDATTVPLDYLGSLAIDAARNVWVTSASNGLVKIGPSGVILGVFAIDRLKSVSANPTGRLYVATQERVYRVLPDDTLVPFAAMSGPVGTMEGPGTPGATTYSVGLSPYASPQLSCVVPDEAGRVSLLEGTTIRVIPRDCAASATVTGLPAFSGGAAVPGGALYLVDTFSNQIWKMDPPPLAGAAAIALGPAPVRPLGSGIVLKRAVRFAPGDFGAVGLTFYEFNSFPVAPGELIQISGTCLGPLEPVDARSDLRDALPSRLGGTRVLMDGIPAPLIQVVSGEVQAVVPYGLEEHSTVTLTIETAAGQVSTSLGVAPAVPAILHAKDAAGADTVVAVNSDSTQNSRMQPAAAGSVIALYATGLGQTDPPSADGVVRTGDRQVIAPVKVKVNGVDAPVLYAGPAPGFAGLEQINIRVPATSTGPVSLSVGGLALDVGAVLWIQD